MHIFIVDITDKKLSKIWIEKTKRKNPPKRESCYVCSEHFEPQCFNRSFKFELAGQKDKKNFSTWCSSDHLQVQEKKADLANPVSDSRGTE